MTASRDRFTQMLCTAQEMEEKGRAFYEKARSTSENPLGKEIFACSLRTNVHLERIRKISDSRTRIKLVRGLGKSSLLLPGLGQCLGTCRPIPPAGIAGSNDLEALTLDFERKSADSESQLAQTAIRWRRPF
jgi:hypothetical protein